MGRVSSWLRDPKTWQFLAYTLAFLSLGMIIASPGPALRRLELQTGSSVGEISAIFTARASGYLVGSAVGGPLCERFNGNRVTAFSLLFTAATTALLPFFPWLTALGTLMTFQGFSMGILDTAGNVTLLWLYKTDVNPYMQSLHFAFGLGAFLSPVIVAAFLSSYNSIVPSFFAIGLVTTWAGLVLLFLPRPSIEPHASGKKWSHNYRLALLLTAVLLLTYVGVEVAAGGFLPKWVLAKGLLGEVEGAYLASVFWGGIMVGRGVAIPISLVVTPSRMLAVDVLGSLAAILGLCLWGNTLGLIYVCTALFGLFMASVFPTAVALAEDRIDVTGKAASLFVVGAALGEMALPLVCGVLFEAEGPASYPMVLLFSMGLCGLSLVLFIRCIRKEKGEKHPREDNGDEEGAALELIGGQHGASEAVMPSEAE